MQSDGMFSINSWQRFVCLMTFLLFFPGQQPLTEESLLKELNVTENVLLIPLINKR